MHPSVPFFLIILYVWIYYAVARSAMRQLRTTDPDYYAYLGGRPGVGMSNSLAVGKMLFDERLPKKSYPADVSSKIILARRMLYLSPLAIIGVITFAWFVG